MYFATTNDMAMLEHQVYSREAEQGVLRSGLRDSTSQEAAFSLNPVRTNVGKFPSHQACLHSSVDFTLLFSSSRLPPPILTTATVPPNPCPARVEV